MTRAEKVAKAQELRTQGLKLREIGEHMDAATSTVDEWLSDPDGAKRRVRRKRYSRPCVDCGAPTCGDGGYANQHERCKDCSQRHRHEQRHWTPARIVEAIQRWATERGAAPTVRDWLGAVPGFPGPSVVQREFGTRNAAIAAAGFDPCAPGHKRSDYSAAFREQAIELYVGGMSTRQVAGRLGVSLDTVGDWLRRAGVTRTPAEARRIRERVAA